MLRIPRRAPGCHLQFPTLPALSGQPRFQHGKLIVAVSKLFLPELGIRYRGPQGSAFWLGARLINQLRTFCGSCLQSKKVWCQMGRRFQCRYVTRCMRTQCKYGLCFLCCWCCFEIVILPDFWLFRGCIGVKFTWLDFTAACMFWKFYFEPTLMCRVPVICHQLLCGQSRKRHARSPHWFIYRSRASF